MAYLAPDLLSNPSVRHIEIEHDPVYQRSKIYRAIPVARLLKGLQISHDDYVQVRATDNFSVAMPAPLLKGAAKTDTEAFLAIEDPPNSWDAIPGKTGSAAPFYIVWQSASAPVARTYWVYRVAALTITDSPYKRWPSLRVPDALAATDPVWRGRDRFVAVCMPCHRFNGDGEGNAGPDLVKPMSPLDYLQPAAHKKLIRDSSAVRTWPGQKMPAFDQASLSDADLEAIIAWLSYKRRSG